MHEMSICEGIVQSLEQIAIREQAKKITKVRLEIGCFAGVEISALEFAFDAVSKGSVAENSLLEVVFQGGNAICMECGQDFVTQSRLSECPKCNSVRLIINGGDALIIKSVELL
jgi:hydrogenase nickel incorporation protein HypA/HybF